MAPAIGIYKGSIYAEINDRIVRYSLPARRLSYRPALPKPSSPNCLWAATIPCIRSSSMRRAQCSWMSLPPPIPASQKTGNLKYLAQIPAPNLRLAAAYGVMTRTRPTRCFLPLSGSRPGYATREGFAIDSAGRLFVSQHGRDQLHTNWPELYKRGRGSHAAG